MLNPVVWMDMDAAEIKKGRNLHIFHIQRKERVLQGGEGHT